MITGLKHDQMLAEVIKRRGYLVLMEDCEYKIGQKVYPIIVLYYGKESLKQPFTVIAETTAEDYMEQRLLLAYFHRDEPCSPFLLNPKMHYYRITTD